MNPSPNSRVVAILALLLVSAGCMVGPNYKRPSAPAAPAFKEQPPVNFKEAEAAGWKPSQPGDAFAKGLWWELYNDAALNALEEQVSVSNQNVLQAEAQYRQAKVAGRRGPSRVVPDGDHGSGGHRRRQGCRRQRFGCIGLSKKLQSAVQRCVGARSMGEHPPRRDGQRRHCPVSGGQRGKCPVALPGRARTRLLRPSRQ